jgi:hypothetical protein
MAVRLSALRTRRTLLPRTIIILMFLVLISVVVKEKLISCAQDLFFCYFTALQQLL